MIDFLAQHVGRALLFFVVVFATAALTSMVTFLLQRRVERRGDPTDQDCDRDGAPP